MNRILFSLIVAFLLPLTTNAITSPAGERLHYIVKWGWLKAGEAELLWQPANGEAPQTITARAWTTNPFFSLRERLTSQSADNFLTQHYEQRQQENDYRAYKTVMFDHPNQQATYENRRNKIPPQTFAMPPNSRDMIAALYNLRQNITDFATIPALDVVVLDQVYRMTSQAGAPYTMATASGDDVTVRDIQPTLIRLKDGQPMSERWQNWVLTVTDDARRLPVKIWYKSKFGTFKAILQDVGTLADATRAPDTLPLTGALPE